MHFYLKETDQEKYAFLLWSFTFKNNFSLLEEFFSLDSSFGVFELCHVFRHLFLLYSYQRDAPLEVQSDLVFLITYLQSKLFVLIDREGMFLSILKGFESFENREELVSFFWFILYLHKELPLKSFYDVGLLSQNDILYIEESLDELSEESFFLLFKEEEGLKDSLLLETIQSYFSQLLVDLYQSFRDNLSLDFYMVEFEEIEEVAWEKKEKEHLCDFLLKGTAFDVHSFTQKEEQKIFSYLQSGDVQQAFLKIENHILKYLDGEEIDFPFNQKNWLTYFMKPLSSEHVLKKILNMFTQENLTKLQNEHLQVIVLIILNLQRQAEERLEFFFDENQNNYSQVYHLSWRQVVIDCHFIMFSKKIFFELKKRNRLTHLHEAFSNETRVYWEDMVHLIGSNKVALDSFKKYGGKMGGRGKNGYTIIQEGYAFKLNLNTVFATIKLRLNRANFKREEQISRYFTHPFVAQMVSGAFNGTDYCYLFEAFPCEIEQLWIEQYIRYMRQETSKEEAQEHFRFLFIQLLLAIHYLHSHQITHGDIKGANIMLSQEGYLKLIDFGLSQTSSKEVSERVSPFHRMIKKREEDILLGRFLLKLSTLHSILTNVPKEEYLDLNYKGAISSFVSHIRDKVSQESSHAEVLQLQARQRYLNFPEHTLGIWHISALNYFVRSYESYPTRTEEITYDQFHFYEQLWWQKTIEHLIQPCDIEDPVIREAYDLSCSFFYQPVLSQKKLRPKKSFFTQLRQTAVSA